MIKNAKKAIKSKKHELKTNSKKHKIIKIKKQK